MKITYTSKVTLRCAYCGVQHEIQIEVRESASGGRFVNVTTELPSCDILSTIQEIPPAVQ